MMSRPAITRRLVTSIYTPKGLKLHRRLAALTDKYVADPTLRPTATSTSPQFKAMKEYLSDPAPLVLGEFDEIAAIADGRQWMSARELLTPAPTTHRLRRQVLTPQSAADSSNQLRPAETIVYDLTDSTVPASTESTMLYLHGGGYCGGNVQSHGPFACQLSKAVSCRVQFLQYDCSPEVPLSHIVEQAVIAYNYITGQSSEYGDSDSQPDNTRRTVSPNNLILAGDSAGGHLVLALLQTLRDRGLQLPRAAWAIAPWGDMSNSRDSRTRLAHLDVTLQNSLLLSWAAFTTGNASAARAGLIDMQQPLYAPLFGDWKSLPPLYLMTGAHELLLDDSIECAEAAAQAGVQVKLDVVPEMFHNFPLYHTLVPESNQAFQQLVQWSKQLLNAPSGR